MLASNIVLASFVLGAGFLSLLIFFVTVFKGFFDDPKAQSEILFDEWDLRYWRIWETLEQQDLRRRDHGSSINAPPGEWGGSP